MGVFADWQPIYEAHAVPTFPVRVADGDKKPAVFGYLKVGLGTSRKLVSKFSGEEVTGIRAEASAHHHLGRGHAGRTGLGRCPRPARADAARGPTGSGNWQAWYRHGGEPRRGGGRKRVSSQNGR